MSKKTAPKKTKKPNPKAAGERALNLRKIAMEEEELRIRRIVSKMLEPVHERLTALESRSAPAEAWVPKVGDWVVITGGLAAREDGLGSITKVLELRDGIPWIKSSNFRFGLCTRDNSREFPIKTWRDAIRPATPAEIAEHKAKEEQRAKEAEWAKFDELQDWDACILSVDLIKELKTMGLRTASETTFTRYDGVQWMFGNLGGYKHGFGPNKSLPEAEFLRRAKGTIAKRAKEERAKEIVKVPEFGTRVKWGSFTGRVACEGPDHQNEYLVAYKPGNGSVWHSTWVHRCDLTVID